MFFGPRFGSLDIWKANFLVGGRARKFKRIVRFSAGACQIVALAGMLLFIEASRRRLPLHLWQRQLGVGVLAAFVACFSVFGASGGSFTAKAWPAGTDAGPLKRPGIAAGVRAEPRWIRWGSSRNHLLRAAADRPGPPPGVQTALVFSTVHQFCTGLLCARVGCLAAKNGGGRPAQVHALLWAVVVVGSMMMLLSRPGPAGAFTRP